MHLCKRIFIVICILIGMTNSSFASTSTPNLRLTKPTRGEEWLVPYNTNFDLIDSRISDVSSEIADSPEVYFLTGTFNGSTGTTITLPKAVSTTAEYGTSNAVPSSHAGVIGDIWVIPGTSSFVVYCSENNTVDTFRITVYYKGELNAYGNSQYREWIVSPDVSITDHGDVTIQGSLAWVINEASGDTVNVRLPGNHTYPLLQNVTISTGIYLRPDNGAIIDTHYAVAGGGSAWTVVSGAIYSASQANEPATLVESGTVLTKVADVGSIDAAGKWCWSAGQISVRTTGSVDPDTLGVGAIQAGHSCVFVGDSRIQDRGGRVFDSLPGDVILSTGPINFVWFGNDDNAIECAFRAANDEEGFTWYANGPADFTITASADAGVIPNHSVIHFDGMHLIGTYDGEWIILNDDATERPRNVYISGGKFEWGDGTEQATNAVAIRLDGIASSSIFEKGEFRYFQKGLSGERWETFEIKNNWFYTCNIGIHEDFQGTIINTDTGRPATSQMIEIHHNQFGTQGDDDPIPSSTAIKLEGPARSLRIENNTFGGNFEDGMISITDSDGWNTPAVNSHGVLIASNRSEGMVAPFLVATHGGADALGFAGLIIRDNRLSNSSADTFTLFDLEYVLGGLFEGNDIVAAGGSTVTIMELDANTTSFILDFDSGYVDTSVSTYLTYACPRTAIHVRPEIRVPYKTQGVVTGFAGDTFSTDSDKIDMSTAWVGWSRCHGIPPVGYFLRVEFSDSGGEGSIRLEDLAATSDIYSLYGDVYVTTDSNSDTTEDTEIRVFEGYVNADENGDIYYAITASGVGTATVRITVLQYIMGAET